MLPGEQAKAGHGQIVGVIGEPGLGKSRLFYEFKLTSQSGCLVLEAFSVSYGKASPFLPIIELLKNYFQIEPQDDERSRRQKVIGQVLELDRSLEEILPYLFAVLGIEDPGSSLRQMDPQIRRQRTFEALKKLFLRESLNQPLVLIFEDLHWIDTETQGFLDTFAESVAKAQVLLLVNYRPEYRHAWGHKTYYTQLRLAPLGKEEAEELLSFLLGNDTSLKALKQLILEKTEGTPFFMEEVVQTLAEKGALGGTRGNYRMEHTPAELQISPTVQGVLAARIDRLPGEEKALLQQLSVIGRQFPASLVQQVLGQSEPELYRLLGSLQAKEFLYEQPTFPEVEYLFKHALTQEVAYGTVLQEQRKALHGHTAQAIEVRYQTSLDDHYSELAHHYQRSQNTEKALAYLQLAGQQALQRSAHDEAIRLFTEAFSVLETVPDSPERVQHELMLQVSLGAALMATKGYTAPEVERTFLRAQELCQVAEDLPQHSAVRFALHRLYAVRAECQKAREVAEDHLRVAHRLRSPAFLQPAHVACGAAALWIGDVLTARTHLEEAAALYDPQQHDVQTALYGEDFGIVSSSFATLALWALGYPVQAIARNTQGAQLAQTFASPWSLVWTSLFGAIVYQYRGESAAVRERADAAVTLSQEHGFPFWLAGSTIMQGWARAEQRAEEEGVAQIREGLRLWEAVQHFSDRIT